MPALGNSCHNNSTTPNKTTRATTLAFIGRSSTRRLTRGMAGSGARSERVSP
jgi:hypothetical protein